MTTSIGSRSNPGGCEPTPAKPASAARVSMQDLTPASRQMRKDCCSAAIPSGEKGGTMRKLCGLIVVLTSIFALSGLALASPPEPTNFVAVLSGECPQADED